jgi:integrase
VINLAARCLDAAIVAGKLAGIKVNGVVQGNPLRMVVRPSRVERIGKVSRVTDAKGPDRHRHIRNDDPDSMQRIVFLTAREIDRLLACDLPPHVRLAYVLALYTGLRRSELAGLQWGDVVRLTGNQPELQVRYGYDRPLKSESAVREVPLLAPARQALIDYRKLLGVLPTPDRHVFLKSDAAAWCQQIRTASPGERYAYTYDWAWRASWRARSGIRRVVTFHAFRHTCGSHLVQGTWTPRPLALSRVKLWLGHSSERVTERHYAALSKDNLHADVGHSLHTDVGHGVTR